MPLKKNKELSKKNYNYKLKVNYSFDIILILIIIMSVLILLFRNILNSMIERIVLFILLFSLLMYITKNILYSLIGSVVIFLLLNLMIRQRNYIESFKNESSEEEEEHIDTKKHEDPNKKYKDKLDSVDEQIEKYKNDPKIKKSAENIQEFLKKLNGNIELKSSDVEETKPLGVNTDDYSDDKKYNALKAAQKETYQLIDSVSALKDTVTTLQPVLSQGKELMDLFHNFKF